MHFIVVNEGELVEKVYELLLPRFKAPLRVALVGDLGAGKTTLVSGLLKKRGLTEPVTSPTFTICKQYQTGSAKIQHLDLYRYSKNSHDTEIEEYIKSPDAISFVEWPENLSIPLKDYDVIISLKTLSENERKVSVQWN